MFPSHTYGLMCSRLIFMIPMHMIPASIGTDQIAGLLWLVLMFNPNDLHMRPMLSVSTIKLPILPQESI